MSNELLEELSNLEHEQWCAWSKSVAGDLEKLIGLVDLDKLDEQDLEFIENQKQRLNRWKGFWVDYDDLSEDVKEQDRKYAIKVIEIIGGKY